MPVGAVKPAGWIQGWLQRQADGMGGHPKNPGYRSEVNAILDGQPVTVIETTHYPFRDRHPAPEAAQIPRSSHARQAVDKDMVNAAAFNSRVKVLFLSVGTAEDSANVRANRAALDAAGIRHVYYESPGTAHEWQTWRKSFYEFAPLLFQN